MSHSVIPITSLADLVAALSEKGPRTLELQTSIACPFSITLPPDFSLTGKNKDNCILGFCNGDGIGLTANNRIANLIIIVTPTARAIYTQTGFTDMGDISLKDLSVTGHSEREQCSRKRLKLRNKLVLPLDVRAMVAAGNVVRRSLG